MKHELSVSVGDKLLYSKYYLGRVEKIVTVTKVTPTGRIRIDYNDLQYDKYGRELGKRDKWSYASELSILTEEDINRIQKNDSISKAFAIISNLKRSDIDYEKALKIIELFGKAGD